MKFWGERIDLANSVLSNLQSVKAGATTGIDLPDNLVDWLVQLTLLYGLPIEYMVADQRLLPTEAMRFFFIDRNWLDRMVDGALSVGAFSTKETTFNEAFYEKIYAQIDARQMQLRSALRKVHAPVLTQTGGLISGLLFRSQVVSAWPGLEVVPMSGTNKVNIIRMDRLSDNTLFCLFDGMPDKVNFIEPGEGLHFGIITDFSTPNYTVSLRGLGFPAGKNPTGEQLKSGSTFLKANGTTVKSGEPGVLDIDGLVNSITTEMNKVGALENNKLTPAGMAIQLVLGAGNQEYNFDSTSPVCMPVQK